MKVLVIDDNQTNLIALKAMLECDGYRVVTAADGADGVAAFELERPDMVLMDVMMPVMDGYEATRQIKQRCDGRFIPVLFVTALSASDDLVKCVDAGGDDFLVRPYDVDVLRAKLTALERISVLHATLRQQERTLENYRKHQTNELQFAQRIHAKVMRRGYLDSPALRHWMAPMALFNGDVLLSAPTPSGGLHVMLGDFTGHGLSAAIGALPVADMFYGMTAKGFAIGDIAEEINARLHAVLYPEAFCAAVLLELDATRTSVAIWSGAMPDICVCRDIGTPQRVRPSHPALGVLASGQFDRRTEILPITPETRIFLCSDGVIEAKNGSGERFTIARVEQALRESSNFDTAFFSIKAALLRFQANLPQTDDISLVEVRCTQPQAQLQPNAPRDGGAAQHPSRWEVGVTLHGDTLKNINPTPILLNLITQIQAPRGQRERIFTILSELLTNAVDHGLLRLESGLKSNPEGFAHYSMERARLLRELEQGWIRVNLSHAPERGGGKLVIRIEDSGPGFDYSQRLGTAPIAASSTYSGRGIALVRSLCEDLQYLNNGNVVEATYYWVFR